MSSLLWNLIYLFRQTPWDSGVTPPELRAVVEDDHVQPGRALDLGCGTGTNVIYLAQHGFDVVGVDISSRAIVAARRRIERADLGRHAHVYAGDVTRLDVLPAPGPFDLALDIGCLHVLDALRRERYADALANRIKPGGLYLLYAFGPRVQFGRKMGIAPEETEQLFAPVFKLLRVAHGYDRGGVGSAWYTFQMSNGAVES